MEDNYDGKHEAETPTLSTQVPSLTEREAGKEEARRQIARASGVAAAYEEAGLPVPEWAQLVPTPPVTGPQKAYVGFVIALLGSGVTAAVPYFTEPPATIVLAIATAVLTAAGAGFGVYQTTNRPR